MIFVTGFPGFLASALLPHLLRRSDDPIVCLVQARYHAFAQARAAEMTRAAGVAEDRVRLVEGDLLAPGLGLTDAASLHAGVREVYHFAALYDLGAAADLAEKVNVTGTEKVVLFAQSCPHLCRLHYISTCYVSGRHDGVFTEDDLDVGQTFNNHYEETKYRAEKRVQQAMQAGLPATIYRPAIVVGDSKTGATQKYDGPYYIIRWLLRWGRVAPVPLPRDAHRYTVNLVPRDFVINALAYLSAQSGTAGHVYQLCDPHPLSVPALLETFARVTETRIVPLPVSPLLAGALLAKLPFLARAARLEPQTFPYFAHPTRYTCEATLGALAGTGITCPPVPTYARTLVDFVRAHPEVSSEAMV